MVKALPVLAILKIITTSGDFMRKKKKHPTNKQVKPNKRVIQDKLCMSCMDLLKSSSTRPRRIELEEKLANTHLYIQRICKSKDHPSPPHL